LFREHGAPAATWRELGDSGQAPKMSDQQVLEYGRLLVRISDHYGFPVDTEWALAGGEFHVLQARPITTLADEYREPIVDTSVDWQLLVRRPMTLLESSIWAHWMDSEHAAALPMTADRALSIQDDAGMANDFLAREAMDGGRDLLVELCRTDRGRVVELLKRGHAIYRDSQPRIERGAGGFASIAEACEFFVEAAQFTTIFPAWVLVAYEHVGLDDPEIRQLAEGLRAHTLYPSIERRIIDPLAEAAARAVGFSAPEEAPKVTTWGELRSGRLDRDLLESRLEAVRAGKRFVFQSLDGSDRVRFVSQTGYLLMRLARQRQIVIADHPNELRGQPAWPGVYRGRARLVLAPDAVGQTLIDGEVLVSIQSSPALMPLLERCGAIVTDDGGIVCHAAILSRELRKPALIGTGRATSLIRTGDLVEVDTYAQVVRILERAGAKPAQK
jgi:phosphohistidine swiveling domain-containing protein